MTATYELTERVAENVGGDKGPYRGPRGEPVRCGDGRKR